MFTAAQPETSAVANRRRFAGAGVAVAFGART